MHFRKGQRAYKLAICLSKKINIEKEKVKNFGIRPESMKMVKQDDGDINGTIETIQPTGADWIVGVNVYGKSLFLISSDPPIGKENDTVGIFFKPEDCHSFDHNDLRILKN